ncbi:MAG TPA: XRE family transcriptional regulator [Candidatus Lokiarchaeia archaeon]|nr:XRE family transcriptional regulator [Candidatus Lokiarchaeia archaeon]
MKSIKALVTPELLEWARTAAGYSVEQVAKKLKIPTESLRKIEKGNDQLTIPQLRKIADLYKRPTAIFYLDKVPELSKIPDFRAGPDIAELTPHAEYFLRYIRELRQNAVDIFQLMHKEPSYDFIGSFSVDDDPEIAAQNVKECLNYDKEEFDKIKDPAKTFKYWREKIELKNILVFQIGKIDPSIYHGFVYAETPVPVIAVNQNDLVEARSFTLIHEFCHVILNKSGICNPFFSKSHDDNRVERFCQRVAAATLMAKDDAIKEFSVMQDNLSTNAVSIFAKKFKTSYTATLIRLHELGLIDDAAREKLQLPLAKSPKVDEKGGNFYNNYLAKMSPSYLHLVFEAADEDLVHYGEVVRFLGLKLEKINNLRDRLEAGGILAP